MLLVVDIGNTNLVLGIFEGNELKNSWRVVTRRDQTADEYAVLCKNLFDLKEIARTDVTGIAICSVVPPLNKSFERLAEKYFNLSPFFVEPAKQDLMSVCYEPVTDVGADRIVTAVAAYQMIGEATIVVDFGTATTFDAVSAEGDYVGGVIAPGIGISAEALFERAAKLPRIEIKRPPRIIGRSTVASMQSGLYFGAVSLVEGILKRMLEEFGAAQVIATGGLASLIASGTEGIDRVEENLILYGLKLFYEHFSKNP